MTTDLPTICYQCGDSPMGGRGCTTCDALQALADVRTLDSWREDSDRAVTPHPFKPTPDGPFYMFGCPEHIHGATPDEARAKAAAWVRGLK